MIPLTLLAAAMFFGAVPVVQGTTANGWTLLGILCVVAAIGVTYLQRRTR